jgi:hypothetical protein
MDRINRIFQDDQDSSIKENMNPSIARRRRLQPPNSSVGYRERRFSHIHK